MQGERVWFIVGGLRFPQAMSGTVKNTKKKKLDLPFALYLSSTGLPVKAQLWEMNTTDWNLDEEFWAMFTQQ